MKIGFDSSKKTPDVRQASTLRPGDIFILASDYNKPNNERKYYLVTARPDHYRYLYLSDSAFVPFPACASVIVVKCELTIFGLEGE